MRMRNLLLILVSGLALAACGGWALTPAGGTVRQARTLEDVEGCELVGTVTGKVSSGMGMGAILAGGAGGKVDRSAAENDALIDARNKAGILGANRILASNQFSGGRQDYEAYRCP
jgi:hypothetical protein